MLTIKRRLGRRTFFLVPRSPAKSNEGKRFYWGAAYTKAQNENSLGFVFGRSMNRISTSCAPSFGASLMK